MVSFFFVNASKLQIALNLERKAAQIFIVDRAMLKDLGFGISSQRASVASYS
jgi:hypothetical protein